MEEKLEILYDICDVAFDELSSTLDGLEADKLSSALVDYIDKLTHTIKSVKTTIAMMESEPRRSHRSYESYAGDSAYPKRNRHM